MYITPIWLSIQPILTKRRNTKWDIQKTSQCWFACNGGIRPQEYRNRLNTSQCLYCLWLWEPLWLPSHPAPTEIRSQKNQISTNPANAVLLMPHKAYSKFAICKRAYPNHFYRPKWDFGKQNKPNMALTNLVFLWTGDSVVILTQTKQSMAVAKIAVNSSQSTGRNFGSWSVYSMLSLATTWR